ncbi:MAG: transposase [Deltaproteobacteria bacterium]|nr:transposase [Deltaproteobacteria bacterium]
MAIIPRPFLFGWKAIETASDMDRLRLVFHVLPDERLVSKLELARGKGRDDYPVRPVWNALIAGIVFNHLSIASLRRELLRNGELRCLCGFDPFLGAEAVPTDDAFSRFLALLMEQDVEVVWMFHALVEELKKVLPDLGEKLAADSKAIASFGKPVKAEEKMSEDDRRRDVDANWGVKTYRGKRADGTAWEKVKSWFGYKLHVLVDSVYEMPLSFMVTKASEDDMTNLLPLVEDLKENHKEIADGAVEVAADKGYDSAENNASLYDEHGIIPVIDNRHLWKDEPGKPRPLNPDRPDVFLYNENGAICCQCPSERQGEDETRELAFVGFEKDRMTLKYRCPAAYYDFECKGRAECEKLSPIGVGDFGRVVRVPLETDRRIFTPIPRHTLRWEKEYDLRTSVERVNSRLDRVLGFELHTTRGIAKMKLRVTLALVVVLAMALGRIRVGQKEKMRSMVAPVERAA